jgi:hypothetical protein
LGHGCVGGAGVWVCDVDCDGVDCVVVGDVAADVDVAVLCVGVWIGVDVVDFWWCVVGDFELLLVWVV